MAGLKRRQNNSKYTTMSGRNVRDARKYGDTSSDDINSSPKSTSRHTQKRANPQNASQSKSKELEDSTKSKFYDTTIFTYGLDFESVPKSCEDANKELPVNFNIDSSFFELNGDQNISKNFENSMQLNVIDFPVIKELLTQILEKVN